MNTDRQKARLRCTILFIFTLVLARLWFSVAVQAQEGEIVANLATGRVVIYVAKDGIAIGAYQAYGEGEGGAPVFVQMSGHRVGILLGAVEWLEPESGAEPFRVAPELPRLLGQSTRTTPRLVQEQADDIERIGLGLLEVLRPRVRKLHRRLDLREEEPLVELLLVGYVADYGPEVWSLTYRIVQEPVRGSYWQTRIQRPRYAQLYPPEKDQPKTLVEVHFPPEGGDSSLLERIRSDPKLAGLGADSSVAEALQNEDSTKAKLDDVTQWLRGVLDAVVPADTAQVFAVIAQEKGFAWVLAPPEGPERAKEEKEREPGAPTLRKKP